MVVRDDLCTRGNTIHGGAVMALADAVGAAATVINLSADATGTTTIESKTNFIKGASEGSTVTAIAEPVHRGRRTQVWQTRIETDKGGLVCNGDSDATRSVREYFRQAHARFVARFRLHYGGADLFAPTAFSIVTCGSRVGVPEEFEAYLTPTTRTTAILVSDVESTGSNTIHSGEQDSSRVVFGQ